MVGKTGKIRNNGSSPTFVVEQKHKSVMEDKYRRMYKNMQPSQRYHVKQQAGLQKYLAYNNCRHEYGNHYKYSESVPLLHREKDPQCSTTGFFKRSSTLLTF